MKDFTIEDRIEQAVLNFQSGYNCAQSVFLAYSDVFDIDIDMAKKMSVSFGGGLGRMREVCGTVSAMSMLAGFRYPVVDTLDKEARKQNYQIVQKMAGLFKEKNGSIVCRELLRTIKTDNSPMPSDRTVEYYKKRPCAKLVADSALIAGSMLKGELGEKD